MTPQRQLPCTVRYMAESVPKDRDPESGQFTEVVTDDELLAFLEESGGASTTEVASEFDYERPTAYRRLKELREQSVVTSREVGNSLLWMVAGDEGEA